MPISALPSKTVRSLGSSQVLVNSISVVKELLDNALDAQASSILVDVSANGLDVIQVKDNGFGIAPDDRSLVSHCHCTSKIQSYDDIDDLGGKTLGFRGEALASIADMSGSLRITTKVEGEATGVSLKFSRSDHVESQERASHPVGTTVRVQDFLSSIPVRRQTALKSSAKNLSSIKILLQDYAFARPCVRFAMKVVKAKGEKGDWSYVPKKTPAAPDVTASVYGNALSCSLTATKWPREKILVNDASTQITTLAHLDENLRFEALLPSSKCDHQAIVNARQHIIIDGRPVSITRGISKQIVSMYKKYLAAHFDRPGSNLSSAFLYLNVFCPARSYDVNVEPAKDDVLFVQPDLVLDGVECLLKGLYGEILQTSSSRAVAPGKVAGSENFDKLLNGGRRSPVQDHLPTEADTHFVDSLDEGSTLRGNEDWDGVMALEQEEAELRRADVSNPWTFAKMNAPIRRNSSSPQKRQLLSPERETHINLQIANLPVHATHGSESPTSPSSPIPFPYPLTARHRRQVDQTGDGENMETSDANQNLDSWLKSPNARSDRRDGANQRGGMTAQNEFVPATSLTVGTRICDIPEAASNRHRKGSPIKRKSPDQQSSAPERLWFGHTPRASASPKRNRDESPCSASQVSGTPTLGQHGDQSEAHSISRSPDSGYVHVDLASVMDYEQRKADAMRDHRLQGKSKRQLAASLPNPPFALSLSFLPSPQSSPVASSPHQNRYNKARAALSMPTRALRDPEDLAEEQAMSAFEDRELRTHPTRGLDRSKAHARPQELPLESIDPNACTRDLVKSISATHVITMRALKLLTCSDPYLDSQNDMERCGFKESVASIAAMGCSRLWSQALARMVKTDSTSRMNLEGMLEHDISNALAKLVTSE